MRCEHCGTSVYHAGVFGVAFEDVSDREHTDGQCLEYVKAALGSYKRENAKLRVIAEAAKALHFGVMLSEKPAHEAENGRLMRALSESLYASPTEEVRGVEAGVAQKVRERSGKSTPETAPAAVQAVVEQRACNPPVPGSSPGPSLDSVSARLCSSNAGASPLIRATLALEHARTSLEREDILRKFLAEELIKVAEDIRLLSDGLEANDDGEDDYDAEMMAIGAERALQLVLRPHSTHLRAR